MMIVQRVKKTRGRRLLLLMLLPTFGLLAILWLLALDGWVTNFLCSPPSFGFKSMESWPRDPYDNVFDDRIWGRPSLSWTPDGAHIVFTTKNQVEVEIIRGSGSTRDTRPYSRVHVVASDGSSLVTIPNDSYFDITLSPAVSPDGSRIAYSAYRYVGGDTRGKYFERYFEIWTSSLDGPDRRMLTEKAGFDLYPAWSPDGARIAFVRQNLSYCYRVKTERREIYVMNADGSDGRAVLKSGDIARGTPDVTGVYIGSHLAWSPDGQSLAFVTRDESPVQDTAVSLIAVGADGTGWKRLHTGDGDGLPSSPVWSPDGERIAFVESHEEVLKLYTIRRDGSGLQEVFPLDWDHPARTLTIDSWSPDSSEILFHVGQIGSSAKTLYEVGSDGSDLRSVGPGGVRSPDGSRVANEMSVYERGEMAYTEFIIYTIAADGSDLQVLARRRIGEGSPEVMERVEPANVASCSAGVVVGDPEGNPGLVRDCEELVKVGDRLGILGLKIVERRGIVGLNWNADTSIYAWDGVMVGRQFPPRVIELSLPERDLRGAFPDNTPELSELRKLDLSGNAVTGVLPEWLGTLSALEELDLSNNDLAGPIPPELGGLSRLRILDLSHNRLTGPIPPELGNLRELEELGLRRNRLSGDFPSELGKLSSLQRYAVGGNHELTGCIPQELREVIREYTYSLDYCDE